MNNKQLQVYVDLSCPKETPKPKKRSFFPFRSGWKNKIARALEYMNAPSNYAGSNLASTTRVLQ